MTIDAMGYVAPEEWPPVLANLHRAIRRGRHLYLTLEERDQWAIDAALAEAQVQGLPAVLGEVTGGGAGAYHYYPGRERVMRWLDAERLDVTAEAFDQEDGWGYRHLLVRSR
jgi:hypothetical protein